MESYKTFFQKFYLLSKLPTVCTHIKYQEFGLPNSLQCYKYFFLLTISIHGELQNIFSSILFYKVVVFGFMQDRFAFDHSMSKETFVKKF